MVRLSERFLRAENDNKPSRKSNLKAIEAAKATSEQYRPRRLTRLDRGGKTEATSAATYVALHPAPELLAIARLTRRTITVRTAGDVEQEKEVEVVRTRTGEVWKHEQGNKTLILPLLQSCALCFDG